MKCPECGAKTRVIDSRRTKIPAVRRRRRCVGCDDRFTTWETKNRPEKRAAPTTYRQAV